MDFLFRAGNFLAWLLPRRACYALARFIAWCHYHASKKDRCTLDYNLGPVIADARLRERCVRETFVNFAYYLVDFFRAPKISHEFIKKYVRVTGLEHVQWVISQKKPLVIVTAHLGNYELAGAVTSLLNYPVAAVALPHKSRYVNDFFNSRRQRFGMTVIPTGKALKGCFAALKEGRLLALLGDRDFSHSSQEATMFARHADVPRGPAFFALRAKACLIPAFLVRQDTYHYHLRFEEPIDCSGGTFENEQAVIARYIGVLESYIRHYPGQWYVFEKYWKK